MVRKQASRKSANQEQMFGDIGLQHIAQMAEFPLTAGDKSRIKDGAPLHMQKAWERMSESQKQAARRKYPDRDADGFPDPWDCEPDNPFADAWYSSTLSAASNLISSAKTTVSNTVSSASSTISSYVPKTTTQVTAPISNTISSVSKTVSSLPTTISNTYQAQTSNLQNLATSAKQSVASVVPTSIPTAPEITRTLSGAGSSVLSMASTAKDSLFMPSPSSSTVTRASVVPTAPAITRTLSSAGSSALSMASAAKDSLFTQAQSVSNTALNAARNYDARTILPSRPSVDLFGGLAASRAERNNAVIQDVMFRASGGVGTGAADRGGLTATMRAGSSSQPFAAPSSRAQADAGFSPRASGGLMLTSSFGIYDNKYGGDRSSGKTTLGGLRDAAWDGAISGARSVGDALSFGFGAAQKGLKKADAYVAERTPDWNSVVGKGVSFLESRPTVRTVGQTFLAHEPGAFGKTLAAGSPTLAPIAFTAGASAEAAYNVMAGVKPTFKSESRREGLEMFSNFGGGIYTDVQQNAASRSAELAAWYGGGWLAGAATKSTAIASAAGRAGTSAARVLPAPVRSATARVGSKAMSAYRSGLGAIGAKEYAKSSSGKLVADAALYGGTAVLTAKEASDAWKSINAPIGTGLADEGKPISSSERTLDDGTVIVNNMYSEKMRAPTAQEKAQRAGALFGRALPMVLGGTAGFSRGAARSSQAATSSARPAGVVGDDGADMVTFITGIEGRGGANAALPKISFTTETVPSTQIRNYQQVKSQWESVFKANPAAERSFQVKGMLSEGGGGLQEGAFNIVVGRRTSVTGIQKTVDGGYLPATRRSADTFLKELSPVGTGVPGKSTQLQLDSYSIRTGTDSSVSVADAIGNSFGFRGWNVAPSTRAPIKPAVLDDVARAPASLAERPAYQSVADRLLRNKNVIERATKNKELFRDLTPSTSQQTSLFDFGTSRVGGDSYGTMAVVAQRTGRTSAGTRATKDLQLFRPSERTDPFGYDALMQRASGLEVKTAPGKINPQQTAVRSYEDAPFTSMERDAIRSMGRLQSESERAARLADSAVQKGADPLAGAKIKRNVESFDEWKAVSKKQATADDALDNLFAKQKDSTASASAVAGRTSQQSAGMEAQLIGPKPKQRSGESLLSPDMIMDIVPGARAGVKPSAPALLPSITTARQSNVAFAGTLGLTGAGTLRTSPGKAETAQISEVSSKVSELFGSRADPASRVGSIGLFPSVGSRIKPAQETASILSIGASARTGVEQVRPVDTTYIQLPKFGVDSSQAQRIIDAQKQFFNEKSAQTPSQDSIFGITQTTSQRQAQIPSQDVIFGIAQTTSQTPRTIEDTRTIGGYIPDPAPIGPGVIDTAVVTPFLPLWIGGDGPGEDGFGRGSGSRGFSWLIKNPIATPKEMLKATKLTERKNGKNKDDDLFGRGFGTMRF